MTTINLRDFYPTAYTHDEFVEVSDEVAAELIADKRYEKAHERQIYRYKAQYSFAVENGIEGVRDGNGQRSKPLTNAPFP